MTLLTDRGDDDGGEQRNMASLSMMASSIGTEPHRPVLREGHEVLIVLDDALELLAGDVVVGQLVVHVAEPVQRDKELGGRIMMSALGRV
jgi:hypothetical protein